MVVVSQFDFIQNVVLGCLLPKLRAGGLSVSSYSRVFFSEGEKIDQGASMDEECL